MHALQNIVWPFIGLGAIGAFIDFLIGKRGRQNTVSRLSVKWDKFYKELKLSNFAEKEAMYFINLLDRVFAPKLLRWRRLSACFGIVLATFLTYCLIGYGFNGATFLEPYVTWKWFAVYLGATAIFFAFSLSLTRWMSVQVIRQASRRELGLLPYVALLGMHLILLVCWSPFLTYIRWWIADLPIVTNFGALLVGTWKTLTEGPQLPRLFWIAPPWDHLAAAVWTDALVAFASNAVRIFIALAILFAFIFRTWISRFVDLLKRRLQEEKPARPFTMILGAFGAVAGTLYEMANHFSGVH